MLFDWRGAGVTAYRDRMTGTGFIGFGEAGQAFARPHDRAYDRKTADPATRAAKVAEYDAAEVTGASSPAELLGEASIVLSLVTADQALPAAHEALPHLRPGTLWCDMNSVAPGTKRTAAGAVAAAGARYVDVAVMAPVLPGRLATPLLLAGPHADAAAERLRAHGFANVSIAGPRIGDASAIKMIRSVMVKGIEALSAECVLAAHRAGVADAVLASLDASWKPQGWGERVDYNLDRMLAHGARRAAEMEEVAATLSELGVAPEMTAGTIRRQRALGGLGIAPPAGLAAKLIAIGDAA